MTYTNPEFLYELKIGISALMRACYEVIGACNQIEHSIRLLNNGQVPITHTDGSVEQVIIASSRTVTSVEQLKQEQFKPTTKPRDTKGDPLAELVAQMTPEDREKLIAAMEGKK